MLFIGLFFVELLVLFFVSKSLIRSLASLIYTITRSHKAVVYILAILFLPGTIIHELAHLLTAGVMFVHVGEIDLFPEVQEDGVRLGSVQIGLTDPFRRMIIGVAPVIVGICVLLGVLYFAQLRFSAETAWWQIALLLYTIFEVGNTMFSSKKDMEGVVGFVLTIMIVLALIIGGLMLFGFSPIQSTLNWIQMFNLNPVTNFFTMGAMYMVIPIVFDLMVILLAWPFVKRKY